MIKNLKTKVAAAAVAASGSALALADGIDTTQIVSALASLVITVTAVGGALLTVYVTVKGFKMIRASLG